MLRIFLFLLLVLGLGFLFSWVADRPGEVALEWQGMQYNVSLMTAVAGLVAIIAAVMIIWTIIRAVLNSPGIFSRWNKQRKKDRGYDALSKGLIAAGSGDAASARRFAKDSVKLLGQKPLVSVLDAQTSLLEGKRDKARDRFEEMLENEDTKLIGLRGLFLEAEKQGAKEAARHYVDEAAELAPSVPWAGNAKLRYCATDGDWEGALQALDSNRAAGLIDKTDAKRQRSVLLTAHAMMEEQGDPSKAAKLAKEAHKLAPDLVPAAVVGASAFMRNNDLRKASNIIEAVWKKEPHPELAHSYVNLRIGDSALDRLKRAQQLSAMKAHHPEGSIAIAEAAIEAKEWDVAREAMKSVINNSLTQRACLIMADIEEGEFGDKGRMRDWLSRAVRAPKDAAWTADGYVSETWLPISPVTGKVDAFEWKVPVEQLGEEAEAIDSEELAALMSPVSVEEVDGSEDAKAVGAGVGTIVGAAVASDIAEATEAALETIEDTIDEEAQEANTLDEEELEETSNLNAVGKAEVVEDAIVVDDKDESDFSDSQVKFPLDRRPDDPGTGNGENSESESEKKRFGLF